MSEEQNRKIGFDVVAGNQTKETFQEIKQDAASMASSVEQAGQKANRGLASMGDGSGKAADTVDRNTKSIIGSIQRTTAATQAGERGTASYYEAIAKQRGVSSEVLRPYLDQLRAVEAQQKVATASLGNMGMSAKATAAALRGVPAQFTDIVTSLQGGQKPLTVFLQQGGQLKDMFGGAGNAARALGGYIMGLVNPFTVLAGAVALMGVAYASGSREQDAFVRAIALSGNASGVTTGQLRDYARQMDAVSGTQAKAAESLAAFAGAGVRGGEQLKQFAQTAIEWEKATGQSVEKTAQQFADLQKDPLKAVLKLNEGTNFLTSSVYEQIRALDSQGKSAEASKVAMNALDSSMRERSKSIQESLGYLERGWKAITGAAKGAWDAMLNVGRPATIDDKLGTVRKELSSLLDQQSWSETGGGAATGRVTTDSKKRVQERIEVLRAEEWQLEANAAAEQMSASAKEASAQATANAIAFGESYNKYLSKSVQLKNELAVEEAQYKKRLEDGSLSAKQRIEIEKQYQEIVAGVKEKYKEKGTGRSAGAQENAVAAIKARIQEEEALIARIKEYGAAAEKITPAEKMVSELRAQIAESTNKATIAEKTRLLALAESWQATEKERIALDASAKAKVKQDEANQKQIDSMYKSADATAAEAEKIQASIAVYGKARAEIERMTLAKLQQKAADMQGLVSPEAMDAINAQIAAQKELVAGLEAMDFKKFQDAATKSLEASKAELAIQQEGLSLIGLSDTARQKLIATRKIELDVAKKIAEVDKKTFSGDEGENLRQRESLKQQIREQGEIDTQIAIGKIQEQYVNEQVRQYDEVFRKGFADMLNNGKDGWKSFTKSLVTTFKTTVADQIYKMFAKPFVVQLVGSFMGMTGGGNGLMGMLGGGGSGGSGSNLLSTGSNLYSAYNTGSSLYAVGSQYFAGTMSAANAGGTLFANSVGGGLDALLATNGAYGTAGGASLGAMSGAGIGAAIVMAAAYLGGMFKSEKQVGAGITGELGGDLYGYQLMREGGSLFSGPSYRYIVAQKELEKARAEIEELKQNPNLETDGNLTYRMKYLRERVEMLQGKYGSSIEASKGPVDILQQSYSAIRESVATQADSLGLDGDAVRKMKTALGLDEIHPDTGGLGIELSGLTEEEATAKVKAALEKANEDLARSVLGSMQEVTREVTRTYADSTTIQDADGNVYENRVWHDVTETVTTMEWVMSEYVREGETAVAALNRISGSLVGVNNVFELLGADLLSASVASGDWASKLIDSMGGIDNLNAAAGGYYDRYYSDDEKRARQISTANSGMEDLKLDLRVGDDDAMQKYRDLVDGAIAAKDEVLLASLLKFAEQFGLGVDAVVSATQAHLDELEKAKEAAEALKQKALTATGLSVDSMVSGFMEQVNNGRGAQAGVWLADTIAVGFEQAIYGQALSVIMNSIIDGVVTPVVTAAMTGSTVSAAISGAAIDTMVANATAAAAALATLMNDPAFKEAMAKTLEVLKDLGNSIGSTIPKMSTYKAAQTSVATSYDYTTSAAESAADAAKKLADQWKSTVDSMSDEMKRLRGELLGESDDQGMAYYESLFAIKTAQARAGDQDAADELPSIIQALEALAKGSAGSKSEVLLMQSAWLDSLGYTRDFLASKYGVDIGNEQSSVTGATTAATVIKGSANTAVLGALQSSSDNPALLAVLQSIDARLDRVEKDQRSLGEAQLLPLQSIEKSNKRMQILQEMEGA